MLKIIVPGPELYDPEGNLFFKTKDTELTLEHSLVSLSKWESKWKVPFLNNNQFTPEQFIDYVRCMTLTQNVDPSVYTKLTQDNIKEITQYMEDPMTATTINDKNLPRQKGPRRGSQVITSELIYYWMTALNIPFECQKWHLNRLMMLIKVASVEQQPPKQMSKRDIMAQNKSLNAARRAKHMTRG